jgi:hypothetical protein
MNRNRLDEIIKEKLTDYKVEHVESDWDLFETMLDRVESTHELADEEFDKTIASRINQNKPHFAHDWSRMQLDLNIINQRRQSILITKTLEAIIVCLSLYTISISPIDIYNRNKAKELPTQKPNINPKDIAVLPASKNHNETYALPSYPNGKTQSLLSPTLMVPDRYAEKKDIEDVHRYSRSLSKSESEIIESLNTMDNTVENTNLFQTSMAVNQENSGETIVSDIANVTMPDITPEEQFKIDQIAVLPTISPMPESEIAKGFAMNYILPTKSAHWKLGAWTAAEVNVIKTPYDKIFSLLGYNHMAFSQSYGLSFSRKKERLSITSGLNYQSLKYQPKKFVEQYSNSDLYYFESSINAIKFDILRIPIQVEYDLYTNNAVSFYGKINVVPNFIIQSDYDVSNEIILGRPVEEIQKNLLADTNDTRINEKNFTDGIFYGSKIGDSFYATVGIGLGLEKMVSPKISLFAETSYSHHMYSKDIGIGPNKDRIHNTSLLFGAKTIL